MNASLLDQKAKTGRLAMAAWVLMVLSPFVLLAVVSLLVGHNALFSNPVWTDELDYWRSVYSWVHTGGAAGYSGVGEQAPLLGSLSVHGVTPLLLYGGYALLFGWDFNSIVLCNALWISAGALVFCLLNRPKGGVALSMAAVFMLYSPVVLYCATSMTEMANYGLLLFYLAFITRLYRVRKTARKKKTELPPITVGLVWLVLAGITVLLSCAYRITYLGLFIPLVVVASDGVWSGKMMLGFLMALLFSLFVYYITVLYASPFTTGFLYNFLRADTVGLGIKMFLSHAKANVLDYFINQPGNRMEAAQRWLYCGVGALTLMGSFIRGSQKHGRPRLRLGIDGFSLLMFITLFLPFAIVICAYETNDWSDYRTLAPFLWLVVTAYLVRGRKLIPLAYLAGCVAALVVLLSGAPVGAYGDENRFVSKPFTQDTQALCQAITYDAGAENPYANSVRTDLFTLETVALLDPGIGLQTGWFTQDTVGKSRWILTDHLKIPIEGYELVLKNDSGSVYRRIADY